MEFINTKGSKKGQIRLGHKIIYNYGQLLLWYIIFAIDLHNCYS